MPYETISDFVNMCLITESGSDYTLIMTNTYSRSTYAIQISKDLFNKAMETRNVWNEEPYKVSDMESKQPESMTT